MIEKYIYSKITNDPTLQQLLHAGSDYIHVYVEKVPRGIDFERGVVYSQIGGTDGYPNIKSTVVQFNIYGRRHSDVGAISQALYDLFNEDNNQTAEGVNVVYSQRQGGEVAIPTDLDDPNYFARVVSFYFKLR